MSPKITQAILPIAGLGTRFLPWTKSMPKEMLPIGTEPIIALIVDECLDEGITDICFVISEGKELIPKYFMKDEKLEAELAKRGKSHLLEELRRYDAARFHVAYQSEQLGDGHAILQAEDWVTSDSVAVLFGDDLFVGGKSGLHQLMKAHALVQREGECALIAVEKIPKDKTKKYGIIGVESEHPKDPRLKKVRSLVEKPAPEKAPSDFGIVGRYIIPRSTFQALQKAESGTEDREIRLIDALTSQLKDIDVYGYACEGTRLDTGTPEGYQHAVTVMAKK
jgi:UTP--glucose-1-phosphate uridylyltransferase